MSLSAPPSFTRIEIESFLPSGWGLAGPPDGAWDARRRRLAVAVRDPADNDWQLMIEVPEADRLGRLEALRLAVDRVYREALG